jgi:hypothetical protein
MTSGTWGLKRIVPPLQGSGIGLGPVDPGRWPGLVRLKAQSTGEVKVLSKST